MKRYLLDVNVVLDVLLNRPPRAADGVQIWNAHRNGDIEALLAAFTVPTIFYIVQRLTDLRTAHSAVQHCLATLSIALVDEATLLAALAMTGADFEDNLQIACAVQAGVDGIVTRDARGFAASPLPVLSPTALIAQLPPPPIP
jgi:predicted nucleic acid-binding protein